MSFIVYTYNFNCYHPAERNTNVYRTMLAMHHNMLFTCNHVFTFCNRNSNLEKLKINPEVNKGSWELELLYLLHGVFLLPHFY